MHSNTETETQLASERKWRGEKKASEKCERSDDESLVAGGCRSNVCMIPFCFLSLSDRTAPLLSAKPLDLFRKYVLILLCFVSTPSDDSRHHLS